MTSSKLDFVKVPAQGCLDLFCQICHWKELLNCKGTSLHSPIPESALQTSNRDYILARGVQGISFCFVFFFSLSASLQLWAFGCLALE